MYPAYIVHNSQQNDYVCHGHLTTLMNGSYGSSTWYDNFFLNLHEFVIQLRASIVGLHKLSLIRPRTRPVSDRTGERRKNVTQPDPSYHPYTLGLSTNLYIEDQCREDTRARGRTQSVRHVGHGPTRTIFSLSLCILFFLSLRLNQSRTSDWAYKEENEKCDCVNEQIGLKADAPSH